MALDPLNPEFRNLRRRNERILLRDQQHLVRRLRDARSENMKHRGRRVPQRIRQIPARESRTQKQRREQISGAAGRILQTRRRGEPCRFARDGKRAEATVPGGNRCRYDHRPGEAQTGVARIGDIRDR